MILQDRIQKIKHIIYRFKTELFVKSRIAVIIRNKIWKVPAPGVVTILFKEEQNILPYFNWDTISTKIAREKLKNFTERYALEPNIVYKFYGDIVIEPEFGLAIAKGRQFIRQSGTLSHPFLKPSLLKYIQHTLFKRNYTRYDSLVHCDGFAGKNLCHFIYDTINPILFMMECNMLTDKDQVLVSEAVFQKPFFQYFLRHTKMGEVNWVVQKKDEWIKVKELRKAYVSMEIFHSTYKMLGAEHKPFRKVFLNRKSSFQRNIKNGDVILSILKRFDFEVVYAEDLSYEQQVTLFREVKYFVGIHGAGLTNLLHADISKLRVLEIFSESLVHASFFRFLKILGVEHYQAVVGTPLDINWNFSIDETYFEACVLELLEMKKETFSK